MDVALIILHGRYGEDGTMQGLLDLLGLPYQGSGVMSSALCMDKRATKEIYRFHGLPVPADLLVDRNNPISTDQIIDRLGLPVVVKPASEGSSLGLSIPKTEADLKKSPARSPGLRAMGGGRRIYRRKGNHGRRAGQ